MQDYETAALTFAAKCETLGLTVACTFVPFSLSRNAKEAQPSLNWKCNVLRNGKAITGLSTVDYMQGSGHCPASKAGAKRFPIKPDLKRAVALECETGKRAGFAQHMGRPYQTAASIAPPSAVDVISALCMDSDVIDYARFEDWAECFGYDADSRSAEKTYRACLEIALALRAAIGETELQALREVANEL